MNDQQQARLSELRALPAGWLDGEGVPPSAAALKSAETFLVTRSGLNRIYPMPCGGIEIETLRGFWDLTVGIEADGRVVLSGVLFGTDADGEMEPSRFDGFTPAFYEAFDAAASDELAGFQG